MNYNQFVFGALFLALAWVSTQGELAKDKRYLKCHNAYEVCNGTNCCNETFTCQPYVPLQGERKLYANEMRCMPPNSTMPMKFPYTCHAELEVCYKLGCCNPDYSCAPYHPQYPGYKPPLFPCEYRCEFTANITAAEKDAQTAVQCLDNFDDCGATMCDRTTCTTTANTACPAGQKTNCTTTSMTSCMNPDNSTSNSTATCASSTT